ncbi:RNA polymerase sigma factor [Flexithrix dorotheae]|uniref:RNA polymerase sigma factor n=1 Tax=Flexithrix dorotheae TaxID=70993 RepID=UPI0003778F0A|nr:sigma-70 family RNA polymerase sigma factor [Flexithrix dorotheae]
MMKSVQKKWLPEPKKVAFGKSLIQLNQLGLGEKSDKEIWQLFKEGNEDALCFIYNFYVEKLYVFGHQITRNKDEIKDGIHDLFVHLKIRRKSLGNVISIKSYLYRCLWRLLQDKSKKKSTLVFEENQHLEGFAIKINAEVALIEGEAYQEKLQFLSRELNTLSKKQKQAIVHYYYEGFSHEEIAYIMGLKNKDSARKLIYRGIESLKERIG